MTKQDQAQDEKRGDALTKYAHATTPKDRNRAARAWLDAGGQEVVDAALRRGLAAFKVDAEDEDRR